MNFTRVAQGTATLFASAFLFAASVMADPAKLEAPEGTTILSVSGNIAVTNADGAAEFDREMLEELGMQTIVTSTPWFTGKVTFEGVPLAKLLERVGAKGEEIVAIALNDYRGQVPVADAEKYGVILALKRDGEYMPVRDKGPIFIVYPYDEYAELHDQMYYGRSVWQVARLVVR